VDPKMAETRVYNGNLILVRVPGFKNKIVLYECLIPYTKTDSFFDDYNMKFPMFLIAFGVVIVY
jgi:hypothetical protein